MALHRLACKDEPFLERSQMQHHELRFTRQGGCSLPGLRTAGLFTALLLLLAGSASAQVSTASVNGVIRDPKGSVIPGASIVLSSVDTSVERTSVSNGSGEYVFLNITPGRYTLSASDQGFNPQKIAEFVLAVSQIATFDFTLTVGTQTQVVTVEATTAQLDVSSASLGTVIATKQVNDL